MIALLLLAPLILTGAALAAPVPLLDVETDARWLELPLDDGENFAYTYEQSIYQVPVLEELTRSGDAIRILRIRSKDIRAVEYFRWDGRIDRAEGVYVQAAPVSTGEVGELVIRVTTGGQQRLMTTRWDVGLRDAFGEEIVHVRPLWRPLAAVLFR